MRRRLPAPDPATGASLTDVVGTLTSKNDAVLVVETRSGPVEVHVVDVVAAKVVPPRPSRRGAPHLALSVDDLQRVLIGAWGALEREPLGEWQLRASRGFTARGNSVATPGSPGVPLEEAVAYAMDWYAGRGLPLNVTLAGPVGFAVADDPLGAFLLGRGARVATRSLTLTASATAVTSVLTPSPTSPSATSPSPSATSPSAVAVWHPIGASAPRPSLREELTDRWLRAYGSYRTGPADAVRGVLTGSERQWFAEVEDDDELVGIGRLAVNDGWGGIAAMWVDPDRRRAGLARAMLAAMAARAVEAGAGSLHLQVLADNDGARQAYAAMGFVPHHEYVNLVTPTS
ncbi:putative acetyltransferase [Nostocoides japonicum T1-X7]|uniref:Putative acetyltransferase n=1 Tax=Nostocoides japonicum T1-X7 TaxID=1194083 RepID=A0A077LVH0_9MICO|nr:putative acetyltransferase [Tetrasphaera japonica T1-X7]